MKDKLELQIIRILRIIPLEFIAHIKKPNENEAFVFKSTHNDFDRNTFKSYINKFDVKKLKKMYNRAFKRVSDSSPPSAEAGDTVLEYAANPRFSSPNVSDSSPPSTEVGDIEFSNKKNEDKTNRITCINVSDSSPPPAGVGDTELDHNDNTINKRQQTAEYKGQRSSSLRAGRHGTRAGAPADLSTTLALCPRGKRVRSFVHCALCVIYIYICMYIYICSKK